MPEPARPAVQLPQVFSMHCWSIPSNVCLNEVRIIASLAFPTLVSSCCGTRLTTTTF